MNLILRFKSILDIPVATRNNEILSSRFKRKMTWVPNKYTMNPFFKDKIELQIVSGKQKLVILLF